MQPARPWRSALPWIGVLLAALIPLVALAFFAAPQADDFCYGAMLLQRGAAGFRNHYFVWSGRLLASLLIPLPSVMSAWLGIDLFATYSGFALAFVLAMAAFSYWLVGRLLPGLTTPARLGCALALSIAMIGNAPAPREIAFWMPSAFTYTLPSLVLLALFVTLYRTLVDRTWLSATAVRAFTPALFLAALCNEVNGPISAWMLGVSLAVRRSSRSASPQTAQHVRLIAAALAGAAIVYLAPGNRVRAAAMPGSQVLSSSVLWGTLETAVFLIVQLPRRGVFGWLILLGLCVGRSPTALLERRPAAASIAFALATLVGACWLSTVAGYFAQGVSLPARALNLLFFLGVLCLSCALVAAQSQRPPIAARLQARLRRRATPAQLRVVGTLLLLSSPSVVRAFWQLPQAPAFRREMQAQVRSIAAAPQPIVYVEQVGARPNLLFYVPLTEDAKRWPNSCLAKFFRKQAVLPKP